MKKLVLSLVILSALSPAAYASQRGVDPDTTLTGKALGSLTPTPGNVSTGSALAIELPAEHRRIRHPVNHLNMFELQRDNRLDFYGDR